jgi:hypothetical protein
MTATRRTGECGDGAWLAPPAFAQMHRVLKRDAFCVSFYGCYQIDLFMAAWRTAGFRSVGHIVFTKIHFKDPHRLRYQASAGPKATRPRRNTRPPVGKERSAKEQCSD